MSELIDALLFTADVHCDEEEGEDSSISLLCVRVVGEIRRLRAENDRLKSLLRYAVKEADGWHNEARSGPIVGDDEFDKCRAACGAELMEN